MKDFQAINFGKLPPKPFQETAPNSPTWKELSKENDGPVVGIWAKTNFRDILVTETKADRQSVVIAVR